MNKKVLVFFPHNPFPPRSGAHKRCLEMLSGLRNIGCDVTLLSSTLSSETKWENESIQCLKTDFVSEVNIYEINNLDRKFLGLLNKYYNIFNKKSPLNSARFTPPGMRRWFDKRFQKVSPDFVFMNYAYWDGLIDNNKRKKATHVIDIHDLLTLNNQMRQILDGYLSNPLINDDEINKILKEDFFKELGLKVYPEEFKIYDKYDFTISISQIEAQLLQQNTNNTKVIYIPMTQEPIYLKNDYSCNAILPMGQNPFNIHGYLYFVKNVLPLIKEKMSGFCLQVTGSCNKYISAEEGIINSGFVPDLRSVYESSRFLICPVYGGTGQQVKIIEAMAHGVPVIALRAVANGSPMQHGINSLIADNAEQFADYVVKLWNDIELCQQLGQAARDTIATKYSRSRLIEGLSSIVK